MKVPALLRNIVSQGLLATTVLLGLGLAGTAGAGCGVPGAGGFTPSAWHDDGRAGFVKTQYFPGPPFGPFNASGITGLWKFQFVAPIGPQNANVFVDTGLVSWHDDGTELMNSGRAAAAGSFCMGVWRQTGYDHHGLATFTLNHWALGWIPGYKPGQPNSWASVGGEDQAFVYAGPTNIRETVTLSRDGKSYSGSFTLMVYGPGPANASPNQGPLGQDVTVPGPLLATITGSVTATRVTAD